MECGKGSARTNDSRFLSLYLSLSLSVSHTRSAVSGLAALRSRSTKGESSARRETCQRSFDPRHSMSANRNSTGERSHRALIPHANFRKREPHTTRPPSTPSHPLLVLLAFLRLILLEAPVIAGYIAFRTNRYPVRTALPLSISASRLCRANFKFTPPSGYSCKKPAALKAFRISLLVSVFLLETTASSPICCNVLASFSFIGVKKFESVWPSTRSFYLYSPVYESTRRYCFHFQKYSQDEYLLRLPSIAYGEDHMFGNV